MLKRGLMAMNIKLAMGIQTQLGFVEVSYFWWNQKLKNPYSGEVSLSAACLALF